MKGTVTTGSPRRGALMAPVVAVMAATLGATVLAPPARAAVTFNVNGFDDRRDTDLTARPLDTSWISRQGT